MPEFLGAIFSQEDDEEERRRKERLATMSTSDLIESTRPQEPLDVLPPNDLGVELPRIPVPLAEQPTLTEGMFLPKEADAFRSAVALEELIDIDPEPRSMSEDITGGIARGASFGLLGEEPETGVGVGAEIAANLLMMAAVVVGTEGGAGILAGKYLSENALKTLIGTRLGRSIIGGAMGGAEGAAISAVSPDEDIMSTVLNIGMGVGAGALFGSFFPEGAIVAKARKDAAKVFRNIAPTEKILDKAVDESLDVTKIGEKLSKELDLRFIAPTTKEALLESPQMKLLKEFNQLSSEYAERTVKVQGEIRSKFDDKIFAGRDPGVLQLEGKEASRELVEGALTTKLGGVLSKTDEEIILHSFRPTQLLNKGELRTIIREARETGKLSRPARAIDRTNRLLTESNDRLNSVVDTLNRQLDNIQINVASGLPPKTVGNVAAKQLDLVAERAKQLSEVETKDPVLQSIVSKSRKVLDELVSIKDTPPELDIALTKEFRAFLQNVGQFTNTERMAVRKADLKEFLDVAKRNENELLKSIQADLKRQFDESFKDSERTIFRTILDDLSNGKVPNLDDSIVRNTTLRMLNANFNKIPLVKIAPELAEREGAILAALPNATQRERQLLTGELEALRRQGTQSLLMDGQLARQVIREMGDSQLNDAYLLYRATLGDQAALAELTGFLRVKPNIVAKDLALGQMLRNTGAETLDKDALRVSTETITESSKAVGSAGRTLEGGAPAIDKNRLIQSVEDAVALIRDYTKDLGTFSKYILSPSVIAQKEFNRATTAEKKFFFGQILDWLDMMRTGRNEVRLLHQNEIEPRVSRIDGMLKGLGKVKGQQAVNFVDEVSRTANEMISAGRFSDETIRAQIESMKKHATPETLEFYNTVREFGDWIRNSTNAKIVEHNALIEAKAISGKEIPLIKDRPGWVPFIYHGNYRIKIYSDKGARIDYGIAKDAEQAEQWIRGFFDQADRLQPFKGRVVVEPMFITETEDVAMMSGFLKDIDNVFGRDAAEVRNLMRQGKFHPDTIKDIFLQNLMKRESNLEEFRLPTIQAMYLNAASAARFQSFLTPVVFGKNLQKASEKSFPKWGQYIGTLADDVLGRTRGIEKVIDEIARDAVHVLHKVPGLRSILETFGIHENGRVVKSVINMLTFAGRLSVLGFNPSSAFINTFLFTTNVAPVIGFRNAAKALKEMPLVFAKNSPYTRLVNHVALDVQPGSFGLRDALSTGSSEFFLARGQKAIRKIDNLGMWMFNKTEQAIRGATLIGAYHQSGQLANKIIERGGIAKTNREKLLRDIADRMGRNIDDEITKFEYARMIMDETNFNYDLVDQSELLRNPTLKPFTQFKTFFLKEVEFLFGNKLSRSEQVKALALFSTIGGAMAIPFASDIDRISTFALGFSPKLWMEANLPEVAVAGIGATMGFGISTRAEVGDMQFFTSIGLTPGMIKTGLEGIIENRPDKYRVFQPAALRNMVDTIDLLTSGELRSPRTGRIMVEKKDLNPLQMLAMAGGIKPREMERMSGDEQIAFTLTRRFQRNQRNATNAAALAFIRGDTKEGIRIMQEEQISPKALKARMKHINMPRREVLQANIRQRVRDPKEREQILRQLGLE